MNEKSVNHTPLGEIDKMIIVFVLILMGGIGIVVFVLPNRTPRLKPEGATSAVAAPKITNSETYLEPVAGTTIKVIPAVPSKEDHRRIDFVVEVSPSGTMAATSP